MKSLTIPCYSLLFAFIVTLVFPLAGSAQDTRQLEPTLSWDDLAAHAGLVGIKSKTKEQFKIDFVPDASPVSISMIKAAIQLSPEEWNYLITNKDRHLLHPWERRMIDYNTWKSTIDLVLPFEGTVKVDRINSDDRAVILRRPDSHSIRVYVLSANADGKSGVLFYFYNNSLPDSP